MLQFANLPWNCFWLMQCNFRKTDHIFQSLWNLIKAGSIISLVWNWIWGFDTGAQNLNVSIWIWSLRTVLFYFILLSEGNSEQIPSQKSMLLLKKFCLFYIFTFYIWKRVKNPDLLYFWDTGMVRVSSVDYHPFWSLCIWEYATQVKYFK